MREGPNLIQEGQRSFRSQVSYFDLVAVLVGSALMIVVFNSRIGAVVLVAVGVVWVALVLRSVIEVNDDGFVLRGTFRTHELRWSDTAEFVVVGFPGMSRRWLSAERDYAAPAAEAQGVIGLSLDAIQTGVVAAQPRLFSVVAAVTTGGELLRVHGTSATPIDPTFPAEAAAELNRALRAHRAVTVAEPEPTLATAAA